MKVSVFEKVTIPKCAEDKKSLAFFSSKPHLPVQMSCNSTEELIDIITNRGWSPFLFKGYRSQQNFLKTSFLVLDIDDGLPIEKSLERVKSLNLFCVCLPSSSHTKEKHKYRLIFVTDMTIDDVDTFKYNMELLRDKFPEADPSCVTDNARFYFPCKFSDDGFIYNGDLIKIEEIQKVSNEIRFAKKVHVSKDIKDLVNEIYGEEKHKVPECIEKMLKNGHTGLPGEWITTLNAFVFTLALNNLSLEHIYDILIKIAPDELDSRDIYCIERAYTEGVREKGLRYE